MSRINHCVVLHTISKLNALKCEDMWCTPPVLQVCGEVSTEAEMFLIQIVQEPFLGTRGMRTAHRDVLCRDGIKGSMKDRKKEEL